jgi:8-oxo-dGTP pyrophosphatase MutT (NUDIX family)
MKNLAGLEPSIRLYPGDAVAALIYTEDGKVLLQKRDNLSTIFYPNHWGFFGGAIDLNETSNEAIIRELMEELNFRFNHSIINRVGSFNFSVNEIDIGSFVRDYYSILIESKDISKYKLGEGAEFALFDISYALENLRIVPYDAFMLWMFFYKDQLKVRGHDGK